MSDMNIADALKSAKYNEAVIVTVAESTLYDQSDISDNVKREIVLIPMLDSINGGIEWKDACASSSSPNVDIGIQRHIRTKKWVIPMLNDDQRNELYDISIRRGCRAAIDQILDKAKTSNCHDFTPTLRVLDIGSGTGLLAMIAARSALEISQEYQCSKRIKNPMRVDVTSVEMASAMARLACKTISHNQLDKVIRITEAHSCDQSFSAFTNSSMKANICTSELLESGLLGEGLIPAIRDAWDRHLCTDALVIPQKARVYAEVIECSWINNYKGPKSPHSFNLSPSDQDVLQGGNVVIPMHSEFLLGVSPDFNLGQAPTDSKSTPIFAKKLTETTLMLEFDFTSPENIPSKIGRKIKKELTAIESGTAHGIHFWWELDLDKETTYSTKGNHWQDHWQQCIFVFGSNDLAKEIRVSERFFINCCHDDYTISFDIPVEIEGGINDSLQKRQKIEPRVQQHISCERALQLNDPCRVSTLCEAIQTALNFKGQDACILDVSDFSLCSLIASKEFDACNVTSIESSCGNIPMLAAQVTQIGNQLPKENCQFQIINAHLESICIEHLHGKQADIIMSEPYYEILEGWNLACALNFYYIVKSLKERGIVKADAASIPAVATVKCCAVEFHPSVTKAHCGLSNENGTICGFKHEDAILYGQNFHTHDIVMPLWQYKWRRMSGNVTLADIRYEGDSTLMTISGDSEWSKINFSSHGTCWAIVHWIDYGCRVKDDEDLLESHESTLKVISTGNRYNQQSVRMMPAPIHVQKDDIGSMHLLVKPIFGCKNNMEDYTFEIKVDNNENK